MIQSLPQPVRRLLKHTGDISYSGLSLPDEAPHASIRWWSAWSVYTLITFCHTYRKHARLADATIVRVSTGRDPPPHKHAHRVKLAVLTQTAEVRTSLHV